MPVTLLDNTKVLIGEIEFELQPDNYADFVVSVSEADKLEADEKMKRLAGTHYAIMRRIVSWKGIELSNGEPAPCTEQRKLQLFGARPDLLFDLVERLKELEESPGKNSEPSQSGPGPISPEPASPAALS